MKLSKRLFALLVFSPLSAFAATAHYYTNEEFTAFEKKTILQKIVGDSSDTEIVPEQLTLKNKDLLSGHYVLNKSLYKNEILILADGPFYATVWRSGTAVQSELKALAALLVDPIFKKSLSHYQIIHLGVYTSPTEGKPRRVSVYQTPGLRLVNQDCAHLLQLLRTSGYLGSAFNCDKKGVFSYIPAYSYAAPATLEPNATTV